MHASKVRRAIATGIVHSIAAALLCAASVAASAAAPATTSAGGGHGAILFSRSQLNPDTTVRSSHLGVVSPAGGPSRTLTPATTGVLDAAGSWSPRGTHIVFERGNAKSPASDRYDVHLLDRYGHRAKRLTAGIGNFQSPVWGPRNLVAFVAKYGNRHCLALVEPTGRRQRDLFCPPSAVQLMRPMWSADGSRLYVAAGYYVGRLDPVWRSLAYAVNVRTGVAVKLTDRILDEPMNLEIAPDGRRAIYSADSAWDMTLVDFATQKTKVIGYGYAPRWSKDGRRIAFTGEVFESGPEFRYYEPLYVMNANGTGLHRITRSRVDNHAYTAADWSDDGVRLLVNRRIYLDPALTVPRYALRIVNVDTRALTAVGDGYATTGAWYEP